METRHKSIIPFPFIVMAQTPNHGLNLLSNSSCVRRICLSVCFDCLQIKNKAAAVVALPIAPTEAKTYVQGSSINRAFPTRL